MQYLTDCCLWAVDEQYEQCLDQLISQPIVEMAAGDHWIPSEDLRFFFDYLDSSFLAVSLSCVQRIETDFVVNDSRTNLFNYSNE